MGLSAAMVIAVLAIALLGWLDDRRESDAALEDFSQEQATLAVSLGGALRARLDALRSELDATTAPHDEVEVLARHVQANAPSHAAREAREGRVEVLLREGDDATDVSIALAPLLADAARVARPGESLVLVMPPGSNALFNADGHRVEAASLAAALASGATTERIDRRQAADLGFPARTAIAGLARIDAGKLGRWGVVVVTSARRERDRSQRAAFRLVLGVTLAGGLVFVFGAIALSKQRRELELARELEVAALTRQRDERLVRADRVAVMGTLATGVAHEISTPLAVITGRTEQLLAKEGAEPRTRRHLEVIHEQAARIGAVVRGFMDLARGGAPVLAAIAPSQIVRAAVRLAEHRLVASGVHLVTDVEGPLPELHCDHRLLEHALVNLLLNACAACERGGRVELVVRADGAHVGFVVDDDGVGISPEAAAKAMEPFFTTKPVGEGTGLGLAITHEIVKAHHGTLTIAPRASGGTRAVISIPIGSRRAENAAE